MRQVADLHIHSRYSRACSPQLTLANLDKFCRFKGLDIIATGDFTFPDWFADIKNQLEEVSAGAGLYKLKGSDGQVKFILSTEISLIYKEGGRVRRIHLVIHAPNLRAAAQLNTHLEAHYNIQSDGRPILGMSAPKLVRLCLNIHPQFLIYPAHIWTPWFSVFGSKSGFDSLEECFKSETENIYAYETGLSSDPAMNWRLSALDRLTCLSSSDAHSLENIGREATIFDLKELNYSEIYRIIKEKDIKSLLGTIEFYPEEGTYYLDGHRDCDFSCQPNESKILKNICPVCQKPLTIGVLNRVSELADRPAEFRPKNAVCFKKLVELDKIIAESLGIKSRKSNRVVETYQRLIDNFGSEIFILLDLDLKLLAEQEPKIAAGIQSLREDKLIVKPGFDGQYGQINIFS